MFPSTAFGFVAALAAASIVGCAQLSDQQDPGSAGATSGASGTQKSATETVYHASNGVQLGIAAQTPQVQPELLTPTIERVSGLVPWPRGIAWVDGKLAVVARGRHRNFGGTGVDVMDQAATIFEIDPDVREPYVAGQPASRAVVQNGRILAEPDPQVVHVIDRSVAPLDNWLMSRPFCTMKYDAVSQNLIFCGYSGVDCSGGGPTFRKNATDALYRYDLRSKRWGIVELHRHDAVPREEQGLWISNAYYPHHDPAKNAPPHGLLNGPNGCTVAGRYLYAVGKDNHTLAAYDLEPIRRDPAAAAPPAQAVIGETIDLRIGGRVEKVQIKGHSAVAAHGGWLYLASRTSSMVVRFPIDATGALRQPIVGELVAEFEPYSEDKKRSGNLWEMIASDDGELLVSMSSTGRVWRFTPDPTRPFDGDDSRADSPTTNKPYLDIRAITGNKKASISNMAFAPDGSLYFCMTMPEDDKPLAGWIMRACDPKQG